MVHWKMPTTKHSCLDVWFVLRCLYKGTGPSMALSLPMQWIACPSPCSPNASTDEAVSHLSSTPVSEIKKHSWTEQELSWVCIVLLDVVYSDVWMYSHLSQPNIYPHLFSILFPFFSHAHPHGAWAPLSTWLTTIIMDYHLPGLWVCSPIIHSSSTVALCGYFFRLILSAATVCSLYNREPSYLSPLLWLQASYGQWDQQEP